MLCTEIQDKNRDLRIQILDCFKPVDDDNSVTQEIERLGVVSTYINQ